MTTHLYHHDSYLKEFPAQVISQDQASHAVILDHTAFYPGGGGQPCDIGSLQVGGTTYRVGQMKKQGDDILHLLEGGELPSIGSSVIGLIDWERRFQLMRTHTAMHILCGVVFRDYGALVTGGNMDPLNGRMDFEFESMHSDLVHEIEERINAEVLQSRPVLTRILPRQEAFQIPDLIRTKISLLPEGINEIRVVEIVGLDLQADGGTHVSNTSEVGNMHIVDYKSKGKINKRIYLELDE